MTWRRAGPPAVRKIVATHGQGLLKSSGGADGYSVPALNAVHATRDERPAASHLDDKGPALLLTQTTARALLLDYPGVSWHGFRLAALLCLQGAIQKVTESHRVFLRFSRKSTVERAR